MSDADLAAARLDAFLDGVLHLSIEDLRLVALPEPDPVERERLLNEVDRAARGSGRSDLVQQARSRAARQLAQAYIRHGYDVTWVGLNWGVSMGPTADRVALMLAVQDAAVAAVLDDVLPAEPLSELREPFELAAGMAGSTTTLSQSLTSGRRGSAFAWIVFAGAALAAFVGLAAATPVALVALVVAAAAAISLVARPRPTE